MQLLLAASEMETWLWFVIVTRSPSPSPCDTLTTMGALECDDPTSLYSTEELKKSKESMRQLQSQMKGLADKFCEFDDGDQKCARIIAPASEFRSLLAHRPASESCLRRLDFEEFLAMQPNAIRASFSAAEIRQWFATADSNDDGVLSVNEFFMWALNSSSAVGARALEAVFAEHDKDGSGLLDFREFEKVATKMGFGTSALGIFRDLDKDRSGSISYKELIGSFNEAPPANAEVKKLCTALMLTYGEDGASTTPPPIDTSRWGYLHMRSHACKIHTCTHVQVGYLHMNVHIRIHNTHMHIRPAGIICICVHTHTHTSTQ